MEFVKLKSELDSDQSISSARRSVLVEQISVSGSRIQDLSLDFTLPGYPGIELKQDGSSIDVDLENLEEYLQLVCDFTVGSGVRRQIDAFRKGMNSVFSISKLRSFSPSELDLIFGGANEHEDWSYEGFFQIIP